jgi:hypothetical protein
MKTIPAKVIAIDFIQVYILCPICNKIHKHGSNGDINSQNYGTRIPHCGDVNLPWIQERVRLSSEIQYELICDSETKFFQPRKIAEQYVNKWYKENQYKEYMKRKHRIARKVRTLIKEHNISTQEAYNKAIQGEIQ